MASEQGVILSGSLAFRPKQSSLKAKKTARTTKRPTAKQTIEEYEDPEWRPRDRVVLPSRPSRKRPFEAIEDLGLSDRPMKRYDRHRDSGAIADLSTLNHRVGRMTCHADAERDSDKDATPRPPTEEEQIAEAWAMYDRAVAEDPSLMPQKPKPKVDEEMERLALSRRQRHTETADRPELGTHAKFRIMLSGWFDDPSLEEKRPWQPYQLDARDATTPKEFAANLWLEHHERLVRGGWTLGHIQQVRRLEITMYIKKGEEAKRTLRWTVRPGLDEEEQCPGWTQFLQAADKYGQEEALVQKKVLDRQDRINRLSCVPDHLGNLYDHSGNYYRPPRRWYDAKVDADVVMHLN